MAYQLQEINRRIKTDVTEFLEECDQAYAQRVSLAADRILSNLDKSPVVLLSGPSGSGKTTTAINLSCAVAAKCRRTLLIDLDPQGNATSGLGVEKKGDSPCVYHLLTGQSGAEEVIIKGAAAQLDLLPSGIALAGAEVELLAMERREYVLKKALEQVGHLYDYIFIDCPPALGTLTLNALTAAHSVLVPIQCEFFALEGLGQLMNTVSLVKKHLNKELYIDGVVCTMYDVRTNLSMQVVDEVKKYFADKG